MGCPMSCFTLKMEQCLSRFSLSVFFSVTDQSASRWIIKTFSDFLHLYDLKHGKRVYDDWFMRDKGSTGEPMKIFLTVELLPRHVCKPKHSWHEFIYTVFDFLIRHSFKQPIPCCSFKSKLNDSQTLQTTSSVSIYFTNWNTACILPLTDR